MSKFILTDTGPLMDALLGAAAIDPRYTRRMVLDLEVGSPGKLYVELFVDDAVLKVEPGNLSVTVEEVTP